MAKLNIKQPKYILPLVILPFLFIIAYAINNFSKGKNEDNGLITKDELNIELQDASAGETTSKIESLKKRFKTDGDFTGIQNVEKENDEMTENSGSLYKTEEMIYIDSLNQISKIKEEQIKKMSQRYTSKDYNNQPSGDSTNVQAQNITHKQDSTPEQIYQAAFQREYQRIQKQMNAIDSMRSVTQQQIINQSQAKQNTETQKSEMQGYQDYEEQGTAAKQEYQNGKTSLVKKSNTAAAFNTLSSDDSGDGIVAMLDETVVVKGSSRIRIRLLEDVTIDNIKLRNGDYLYGMVSGINGQRVNISIKSIMIKGKIFKVDLAVYDNDGMEGFFIPDNQFRELTKEIGASTVQQTNFTFENSTETFESLLYKTINNVIRQLGNTLSKTVRQNKATLKYNTQIYLYNKNQDK